MKTIAKLLSIIMLMTVISVPVYAETTDEMIDYFANKLVNMSDSQKDSYFELLELLIELNDSQGMLTVYSNAMNSMTGGQSEKLLELKQILDHLEAMSRSLIDSNFTQANFRNYVESNDILSLTAAFKARSTAFELALNGMDKATIDKGFSRMQTIFDMQTFGVLVGKSFILVTPKLNGTLYVYESGVNELIDIANKIPNISITDEAAVKAAIQQLANYTNNSSQKATLFNYFLTNGLIIIDSTYGQPGPGAGAGAGTDTGILPSPVTPIEEDLGIDDDVPEGTALFGDIGRYTWAWTAIRQLFIANVIKGKGENEFDPSGLITRAEFSALLTRMLETTIPTDTPTLEGIFNDVNSNKWYYLEVMSAFKAGYVNGVGVSKFDPSANITREQIATILARVLETRGIASIDSNEIDTILNVFEDNKEVSTWAKAGSAMVVDLGVVTGVNVDNKKYFNFKDNATRAEVSVMLYRLAELIETKVILK